MIVNKSNLVALERNFRTLFRTGMDGANASNFWQNLADRFTTTAGTVEYNWLAAIPGMKKLVGEAKIQGLELVKWAITNDEWEDTIEVPVKDIERDQIGVYGTRAEKLGGAAARHPDELTAQVLLAGFTTKDYTGKNFFDTAKKHFPGEKGSFTNKGVDPLSGAAFDAAVEVFQTQKIEFPDGSETKLNLGRQLCLITGPANRKTALEILKAERNSDGATNVNRGAAELELWPELGSSPAWFLVDKAAMVKPLAYQVEKEPTIASVTDPNDSHVLLRKTFLFQAYGRYQVGYFLPQAIWGSTGEG